MSVILLGIGYWIYATALWPSIAFTVDSKLLGSAFGITTAVQNIGMAWGPFIVTLAHNATVNYKHGYFLVNIINAW